MAERDQQPNKSFPELIPRNTAFIVPMSNGIDGWKGNKLEIKKTFLFKRENSRDALDV